MIISSSSITNIAEESETCVPDDSNRVSTQEILRKKSCIESEYDADLDDDGTCF